jgi:hypothetical protein
MSSTANVEYPFPPYDKYLQYFQNPLPEELVSEFIRDLAPSWKRFQDSMSHLDQVSLWKDGAPEFTARYEQSPPSIGFLTHPGPPRGLGVCRT